MKNTTDEQLYETLVAIETLADFSGLCARVLFDLYERGMLFSAASGVLTAPEYESLEAYLHDWGNRGQ